MELARKEETEVLPAPPAADGPRPRVRGRAGGRYPVPWFQRRPVAVTRSVARAAGGQAAIGSARKHLAPAGQPGLGEVPRRRRQRRRRRRRGSGGGGVRA